ncbi:hypothetical protein GBAR_LOCUS1995 [Geodia barretti]|uniref:Uncharacterized protein n=1 Tax=Geodia barretti TaxID=519541 RepID=A0AA35W405_GEOBA|nr:hypothetical protein GBAR_LOCUS1995 [Geodia barretti]
MVPSFIQVRSPHSFRYGPLTHSGMVPSLIQVWSPHSGMLSSFRYGPLIQVWSPHSFRYGPLTHSGMVPSFRYAIFIQVCYLHSGMLFSCRCMVLWMLV